MLQNVYGEEAVLEPHVMPVEAFNISDTAGHTAILPFWRGLQAQRRSAAERLHHLLLGFAYLLTCMTYLLTVPMFCEKDNDRYAAFNGIPHYGKQNQL